MIAFVFQPRRGGVKSRLYSARIKLPGWPTMRTIPLQVSDKRVAGEKLRGLVAEFEREAAGIIAPRLVRNAAQTALSVHLVAFLADVAAKQRSPRTVKTYRRCITKLCRRCGWNYLRDVTPRTFTLWRALNEVCPKCVNDYHGYASSFFNWMVRQGLALTNPLRDVEKAVVKEGRGHRRAFTADELRRLLAAVPARRATVYLAAYYTGLRRHELNRIRWCDVELDGLCPRITVPGMLTKNHKSAVQSLRPELVVALRAFKDDVTMPFEFVFFGKVPNMDTFKRDLFRAGIPLTDESGRRVDFHALRTTLATHLAANGVPPRVAMEIMRHSDLRLTMKVYTDASQLPVQTELARLPSIAVGRDAQRDAQRNAQTGVAAGVGQSLPVASGL